LVQHLLGLASRRPLLVVLEDAHWADATTLELFSLLAGSMTSSAILAVMTSRPEGLPPMPNLAHVTRLTLGRLGRAAVAAIVASTMSGQAAASLVDDILSRTDGIPLFVEELSKAVAERGSALVHADGTCDLPASLYDTLMARLDRLPGQKQVAQIAACIGREFDFRLLAAIAEKPETELRRGLERLCGSELLYCCGTSPDARYRFKHALVREAAYESLLRSDRRSIHARVMKAIDDAVVPAAAEETAEHAAAAGLWSKALHYFGVAGKAALDRAANAEGLALTAKAIAAGEHLAGDTQAQVAMIDLHMARGWAYLPIGDITSLMTELELAEASAARLGSAD
jgi:predicted ATPase